MSRLLDEIEVSLTGQQKICETDTIMPVEVVKVLKRDPIRMMHEYRVEVRCGIGGFATDETLPRVKAMFVQRLRRLLYEDIMDTLFKIEKAACERDYSKVMAGVNEALKELYGEEEI